MIAVLGIDPGTACGWAVLTGQGERLASGTWDLGARRHEGGGMRFVRARRYLCELLDSYPTAHVAYEEVRRHMGVDAAHVYGGIVAVLTSECEARMVPYVGIPVGTIKKHATGKGNAKKDAMVLAARAQWGAPESAEDDDEADALWIASAYLAGLA